jgi:proline iminopeptidase
VTGTIHLGRGGDSIDEAVEKVVSPKPAQRMVEMHDGTRLRTWTTGTRGALPPVVLLHGGPGLWDYLEPVARMVEHLTVVHRFDQRGCGGSDPSDRQTIARHVADVDELRRHWGHDRWLVVGHSFGATLAFCYAVAHRESTAALGYVSGVGVGDWHTLYTEERRRRMTASQRQRLTELEARTDRTDPEEREFRTLSWFTDYADPTRGWELALAKARTEHRINVEANRALNAETGRWSATEILHRARSLTMPCWFIHGACDPRPSSTVADMAGAIPSARLHVIDDAGHEPWCERPDEVRRLLGFLVSASG